MMQLDRYSAGYWEHFQAKNARSLERQQEAIAFQKKRRERVLARRAYEIEMERRAKTCGCIIKCFHDIDKLEALLVLNNHSADKMESMPLLHNGDD